MTELNRAPRATALQQLEALAQAGQAVPLFQGCLSGFDHPDWVVRRKAAEVLERAGKSPQLVEGLKGRYNAGSVDQRYWIMKLLARMLGPECTPWIKSVYLKSKDPQVRTHAISAAKEIDGADATEFLVHALTDDSWLNRYAAAEALEARGQDALEYLQRGFAKGSGDLKYWCLRLLVRILGPESRTTIKKGMKSDDPNIRHYVLRSLEGVEGTWAIPFLVEFLGDDNWSNRRVAADLLRAKGRPALKHLAAALQSPSSDVRFWALKTLGETCDERAVGPLENYLFNQDDPEEALSALRALSRIPASAAARAIIESSYEFEDHLDVVSELLVSMGLTALRPIIEYLDSPNETIQRLCVRSLGALDYPGVRSFATALPDLGDEDREGLLQALKAIPREQLEQLFQRSHLTLDQIRQAAADAPPRAFPTMSTVSITVGGPDALARLAEAADELSEAAPAPASPPAPRVTSQPVGPSDYPMSLDEILEKAVRTQASDIHFKPNLPPVFRIHGNLRQTDLPPTSAAATHAFALAVLPPRQRKAFENDTYEVDAAYAAGSLGRFRVNCYQELQGPCVAMRHIPGKVSTLADLKLPRVFKDIASMNDGLVLVTGPTGSGKSTTLAALVDFINSHREAHVLTIEDPVEFVHENRMSIITSRELGTSTASFADALRAALREDPDVILVGEMRDRETMQLAITAAETGHLVLSTLHTTSAGETVDRIVNQFPGDHHELIRVSLAETLRAVVTQRLVPAVDGKRLAVRDVLLKTSAVANFIRENKLHQVDQAIITGRKDGMQTRDDDLLRYMKEGMISRETAFAHCTDKKAFLTG